MANKVVSVEVALMNHPVQWKGLVVSEEAWHQARLIPTSGISGAEEQERRATSALLAVMAVVKEFSKAVLGPLGAPSGSVETFIEVPFVLGEARVIPDGLIRVRKGSRSWTALVEVKTGRNELQTTQLENYLDVAREQGFDALITISNEIPAMAGQHPTKVDKRKLKKVALHHRSWTSLLSTAVMQKEHRGVSDPEQAWILGELIRYLEHPRSGAMELEDMGPSWVSVRQSVTSGTLRASDKTVPEVVSRFDALLRYTSLRLGRQLGADVITVLTGKNWPTRPCELSRSSTASRPSGRWAARFGYQILSVRSTSRPICEPDALPAMSISTRPAMVDRPHESTGLSAS